MMLVSLCVVGAAPLHGGSQPCELERLELRV